MIAFENDIFPRQIAARPGAAQAPAARAPAAKPKAAASVAAGGAMKAPVRQAGGAPAGGFRIVFEAEARSLAPRPGAPAASPAQPAAAGGGGFQQVFENDILASLPPTPTQSASTSASGPAGGKPGNVTLWDNGGFGFSDILDIINPLQHLPIISAIYRAETGDQIGAIPRILGSMLFGGGLIGAAIGAATAVISLAVEQETGKDIGAHIYTAIFGEGGKNAKSTNIATKQAAPTAATAAAKPQNLLAVPPPESVKAPARIRSP